MDKNHPEMKQCVDKYDVRSFVRTRGLSEILIPLADGEKVYKFYDEINWNSLQKDFAIKDT